MRDRAKAEDARSAFAESSPKRNTHGSVMLLMCDQVQFPKVGILDFDGALKPAPKGDRLAAVVDKMLKQPLGAVFKGRPSLRTGRCARLRRRDLFGHLLGLRHPNLMKLTLQPHLMTLFVDGSNTSNTFAEGRSECFGATKVQPFEQVVHAKLSQIKGWHVCVYSLRDAFVSRLSDEQMNVVEPACQRDPAKN